MFLYRKLRRISYKAKSALRGSHCGEKEFVASRPAAGGESCFAGFYFEPLFVLFFVLAVPAAVSLLIAHMVPVETVLRLISGRISALILGTAILGTAILVCLILFFLISVHDKLPTVFFRFKRCSDSMSFSFQNMFPMLSIIF